jgi:hypothetical protein
MFLKENWLLQNSSKKPESPDATFGFYNFSVLK